jgi:hypothetical protein
VVGVPSVAGADSVGGRRRFCMQRLCGGHSDVGHGYRDLNARLQAQSGASAAGEQTGLPIGKQNTSADAASPPSEQPALLVREGPPSRHDMQQHNRTVSKLNDFG